MNLFPFIVSRCGAGKDKTFNCGLWDPPSLGTGLPGLGAWSGIWSSPPLSPLLLVTFPSSAIGEKDTNSLHGLIEFLVKSYYARTISVKPKAFTKHRGSFKGVRWFSWDFQVQNENKYFFDILPRASSSSVRQYSYHWQFWIFFFYSY